MFGLTALPQTEVVDFLALEGNMAVVAKTTYSRRGLTRRPVAEVNFMVAVQAEDEMFYPVEEFGSDQKMAEAVMRASLCASRYSIYESAYFGF
jgi:hypothetical protein